jgi:hydrogenase maturation protease
MSADIRSQNILVAGVGNIFLGDDAFGVEVVQRLARRPLPPNVQVADFGIRGYDLAYALMEPWELVILVDALSRGEPPGTVYTIEAAMPQDSAASALLDAHTLDPAAVLQFVGKLGGHLDRILVVGCEPASIEMDHNGRLGLSLPVEIALDEAIRIIEALIAGERGSNLAA